MAIGNRIKYIRNLRNLTQKELGVMIGFPERTADVRIAQYESETRVPKEDIVNKLASALDVSPSVFKVPDIDTDIGLIHTLFVLEDIYGLKVTEIDGEVYLCVDKFKDKNTVELHKMLFAWLEVAKKFNNRSISKDAYDKWRYNL